MRSLTRAFVLMPAALLLLTASDAAAQRRRGLVDVSPDHDRRGFWLSLGLAAGEDSYRHTGEAWSNGITKPSLLLALGGTVNPTFRVGGQLTAWADEFTDPVSGERLTESLVGALIVGQVYPARSLGLYLKGGLGLSWSGVSVEGGLDNITESGFGTLYGAGWEIKLGRGLFLTPNVEVMRHRSENRNEPDRVLYERLVTYGVALTFQPAR